ncbi:MAG: hypothetical protein LBI56_00135 [Puniceicoccales bacterium]|jgi:hypothetical protein|nr:hypothetical protein [Puniceicoccales bacterium]
MIFGNAKFIAVALLSPIFVLLLLFHGATKRARKLQTLSDPQLHYVILQNFSPIVQRTKYILCVAISMAYGFILAETSIGNGSTVKLNIGRHLTLIIILLLLAEHLISAKKHAR